MLVLHYTETRSDKQALSILTNATAGHPVSSHYVVGRFGRVYALVDELRRTWHAGVSYWRGVTDVNSASIGIEISCRGRDAQGRPVPYGEAQIEVVIALCADICRRHAIRPENVVGHSDVAPRRKIDPGELFPWQRLAEHGIGFWTDAFAKPVAPAAEMLTGIGYDVTDEAAALTAFQRHYYPEALLNGAPRTLERLAAVHAALGAKCSRPHPASR